jgi:hypothetical protein
MSGMMQTFQSERKATFGTLSLRFCDHEPALVGVTYALWRADIETNGDFGRLYRVELNKVLCVSNENWGWIVCVGFQKAGAG